MLAVESFFSDISSNTGLPFTSNLTYISVEKPLFETAFYEEIRKLRLTFSCHVYLVRYIHFMGS